MANIEIDDIISSLNILSKDETYKKLFSKFLKTEAIGDKERQQLMDLLSELLFNSNHTYTILKYFSRYILQFLSIAIPIENTKNKSLNYNRHVKNCVILSILAQKHPDANRFMLKYFEKFPSPFDRNYFDKSEKEGIPSKKRKLTSDYDNIDISDLDIVNCCYNFLKISSDFFRSKWNWSKFIAKYYNHDEDMVKWLCCQCVSIITGMNENQLNNLLWKYLSKEAITNCTISHHKSSKAQNLDLNIIKTSKIYSDSSESNISDSVISVGGILLPVYQKPTETLTLIKVKSTQSNLRKVALGVAANRAVCLQGPVGSSKTSVVEYLASVTGRKLGESFIKVQLGDQTDSKMLLGTYRCTDIPGEFVWQLGVLTQAVTEGSWLLLEDIDSASMDIATVITSLLENGYLTVPGYRDTVQITPGFQLFVTQRLVSGMTGYYKKHSNVNTLLEKHLMQVNIEPLTQDELVEIVKTLYPTLSTIATRIIDVFMLFSLGHTDRETLNIPTTGRLTSTRDLFKWCARAIIDFDITSPNSALKVLQDAIDTFCCSLPKTEDRLRLASEICIRLGIVETKAEYFCNSYKPPVSLTTTSLKAGRGFVLRDTDTIFGANCSKFSFTRSSSCLLERVICCVNLKEPVLLVGETGTGKTSSVQYLAETIGQKLIVINMNQQSDSADLLGGYKPVDLKFLIAPIKLEYELLFRAYFSVQHNQKFLQHIANCYNAQKWSTLLVIMKHSYTAALKRLHEADISKLPASEQKEAKEKNADFLKSWTDLGTKLNKLTVILKQQNALAFAFIEGSLVKAVENGYWVLLDEINLANAETLECLSGLLEGSNRSLSLLERGDRKPVERNSKFTLFACMNPSTDVGKKDLPAGLRNRFTEFFVEELTEKNDLLLLVNTYLRDLSIKQNKIENIVKFYLNIRKEATINLSDGLGHSPHYSLRTLCRALTIAAKNACGTMDRNLYEAFCLSFMTQLDSSSYKLVEQMIAKCIIGGPKEVKSVLNQPIPEPKSSSESYVQFEGYWVSRGGIEPEVPKEYVLTDSVRRNLKDLVRVVAIGRLPVLLQGDTSVGKTSLITYLAKSSGNKCVRINNHEHTDLQEYIGSYVADADGKLVFREGVLVEAMRKGHWIILDELNLAPTDVLEALNRVLDDNRELFIPETQDTVKAHPSFMLFATQNPPGAYGGRKMLSRAFRNRFVELHFNEIPPQELETILHIRCEIPPSYCKKMIAVMTDLQMRRRGSAAFAGKQGFITLRDLFRWGERYRLAANSQKLYDWDQHIADEGYLVLAGRVRKTEERNEIVEALLKHIKRSVLPENLFSLHDKTSPVTKKILEKIYEKRHMYKNIVWTFNTRQLAVLVGKALEFNEPVLLVGETGGGKTTVCRLIAENDGQKLITVNCHMHTESSDFIGGLRPVRDHTEENKNKLFEWVDGPLIQAMQSGEVFLADEISLADDSVLERLNSLLEPERTLLLAEKGTDLSAPGSNSESIKAHDRFHFIGTMNPGGDFGKKELSPALRNRFTEIWCETCTDRNDLIEIVEHNLKSGLCFGNQEDGTSGIGRCIMDFVEWFKNTEIGKRFTISIRDILTWVNFINVSSDKIDISESYVHGACLTFLDSFGSGVTGMENVQSLKQLRDECSNFLIKQVTSNGLNPSSVDLEKITVEENDNQFGIKPFFIEKGNTENCKDSFTFGAPTTLFNALRLLRGLQLNKAILLEGSPGVGKTSLVSALAKATKHNLLRINLSDQTDICDLFGADLPVEGGQGGEFAWRDGPFLQALKNGDWIVLDELNLASQSVLEGLNACLDHRGEIFIPELGKTFYVQPGTRLFACQNPLRQGGSRRGLPKSFLNRFTQVYVDSLSDTDLLVILGAQFPSIPIEVREKMVEFNKQIVSQTEKYIFGYKGSPWEFNLRDLTRWCEVMLYSLKQNKILSPACSVSLIYGDRLRTQADKIKITEIFEKVFNTQVAGEAPLPYITCDHVYLGDVKFLKSTNDCDVNLNILKQEKTCLVLRSQFQILRSLIYCINLNWMAILVGSGACGKSSIVRTLAQLTGCELRTLSVNSAMDTMDILGGFEQVDYNRHLEEISNKTERLLLHAVQKCTLNDKNIKTSNALLSLWEFYKSSCDEPETSNRTMADETKRFEIRLLKLQNVLEELKLCKYMSEHETQITLLLTRLIKLRDNVEKEGTLNAGGKFEWVDSVLIKCLQDGCWLLIDNVNHCSPAVLDRLNALLEPNGILTIGERGVDENGEMINIKPHPNFRLFLTMDPKNGEISRAMRNRGVEIYMLNECESGIRNELDIKALIEQNGITCEYFQDLLIQIHDFISESVLGEKPTVSHILQSSFLISQQLLRGIDVMETFTNTIIDVYVKSRSLNDFKLTEPIDMIKEYVVSILEKHIEANVPNKFVDDNRTLKTMGLQNNCDLELVKQQTVLLDNPQNNLSINLLLNSYGVTSVKNLFLRYLYIKNNYKTNKNVNEELFSVLQKYFTEKRQLPIDSRWLPETVDKGMAIEECNQLILLLYFLTARLVNAKDDDEKTGKKYSKISVNQYSKEVTKKNVSQLSINNPLIISYYTLLKEFDSFVIDLLKVGNLKLSNDDTLHCMMVLNWRFVLEEFGETIIYDKKEKINIDNIISQLIVRYKWFLKKTVNYFKSLKPDKSKFIKLINLLNKSIVTDLSIFKKIAKRFIKNTIRPLPLTSEAQITIYSDYSNITSKMSLASTVDEEFKKSVNFCLMEAEKLNDILKIRKDENSDDVSAMVKFLEAYKNENKVKLTEVQLLPINDALTVYMVNNLRNDIVFGNRLNDTIIQTLSKMPSVPFSLNAVLQTYANNQDKKLHHEISTAIGTYLIKAVAMSPLKFLFYDRIDEQDFMESYLTPYTPILSYSVSHLCVSLSEYQDLISTVDLGSFQEKRDQFRYLNELLWQNAPALASKEFDLMKNDLKYIVKSFKNFIYILGTSQNLPQNSTLCEKVDGIIANIKEMYDNISDESKEMLINKDNFIKFLHQCTDELEEIAKSKDDLKLTFHTANIFCLLNYCKALLNSQLQVIDPLQKVVLKKKYCEEERNICINLRESFVKSNEIYSGNVKTLHSFCSILALKIAEYEEKETELGKQVAMRPDDQPYHKLVKNISHHLSTLLSEDFFVTIYQKLNDSIKLLIDAIDTKTDIKIRDCFNVYNQTKNWLHSQENALSNIARYRTGYPDIIEPILSNLTELSYGVRLLSATLSKLITKYEYLTYDLDKFLVNLVKFPTIHEDSNSAVEIIKTCTDNKTLNFVSKIINPEDIPNQIKEEHFRLFKCGLQELYNMFVISSPNNVSSKSELLVQLNNLINVFVYTWNKQEEEKQKKLEEENSLYKTQSKGQNLTDEEQADKEMKEMFRNFHDKDFSDFQQQSLEDIEEEEVSNEEVLGIITSNDIKFVCDLHSDLMLHYTKSEWLNTKKNKLEPDFIMPFLQRYKTFAILLQKKNDGFSYKADKKLIPSLNLLIAIAKSLSEGDNSFSRNIGSPTKNLKEKSYDFYHDSKVEEVKSCLHILSALEKKVDEFLSEWPGHPTLKLIKTVIRRIYSFSIMSPVARFLTGLELLLSKCKEWEENAHSGVSLSEYSQNLTLQIISWRKLELSNWKDSLNKAQERVKSSVSKWWFHLYSTVQQFVDDVKENVTPQQIIKTLKEFIENSTLGEFESRLELLFIFHCHSVHLPKSARSEIITSVLWNLHSYYNQFLDNVHAKIKELRAPIEKKLKDFVKIARWNDINYWSVKETVEKTHRTLHKHIKEFETVLKDSVRVCLVHSGILESNEQVGIWDRPQRHAPRQYHYSLDPSIYMASTKLKKMLDVNVPKTGSEKLVDRSEKYFTKSRTLCKDIITKTSYPSLIQNLDSFVTEVIETSNQLRNLEVNRELPKPKQKSQAKSILQQKRKALADLFKSLTNFGVSYRAGIVESILRENSNAEFLIKPLDLKASFEQMKSKSVTSTQMLNVWDGCETYFMRSIARLVALKAALKQPAQDLGTQNIERCKGFSAHLMILAQEQKSKLIDTTRELYYLRHCINQFTDWNEDSTIVSSKTIKKIYDLLSSIIVVMKQYDIILQSCPEQSAFESDVIHIPMLDNTKINSIRYKNDLVWNNTYSELKTVISSAQKLKSYLDKFNHTIPNAESLLETPEFIWISEISVITNDLASISDKVSVLNNNFGSYSVSDSLVWLLQEINSVKRLVESKYVDELTTEVTVSSFNGYVEKLMENILLVIQNMFKKYEEINSQKKETEEENEEFEENHLRVAVIENLYGDISSLGMKKILHRVVKVINALNNMNSKDARICRQTVSNCVPLLEQVVLMYEYFVTQQVAAYRVTCKMNSILLNIFTELASKGFCVPQDLSDELDKEGQSKQQNGMGLGDGEGEKDVSDRIENEDQLDDAQPAGQEKKKDEDKDCKEEDKGIEMSEDFDSKLQDVKEPEEDEESNSDSDADKQMGDTEPNSDKLDQQIWGSDDENEEDGENEEEKNNKEEKGDGGEVEDQKMAAKEDGSKQEEEEDDKESADKKKEKQKDIDEMEEKEYDDDQTDPYHGNQPQMPEPEPMDLPDDLQLDDGEEKEENEEENPFDIDAMKEQMPPAQEEKEEAGDNDEDKPDEKTQQEDSSDEEETEDPKPSEEMDTHKPDEPEENPEQNEENKETEGLKNKNEDAEEDKKEEMEEASGLDNQPSTEDQIQPMDVDDIDNSDNVETNPSQNTKNQQSDQVSQEESHDKDGVGQTQMEESDTGHKGQANANKDSQNAQNEKEKQDKRQRPGESDTNRSLGETNEPVKKKLKTVNIQDREQGEDEGDEEGAEEGKDADMYQHIKEAKETDIQVLDAATKEQAETQKIQELEQEKTEEPTDEPTEMATDEPEPEITDITKQKPEKTDSKTDKKQTDGANGDIVEEIKDIEIEGEVVDTMNVPRGTDSSYHTQYEIVSENQIARLSTIQIQDLRSELESQLGKWNEPPPNIEAEKTWEKFSAVTSSLARDLSEQLRLVLEPTQASRLKGDFKTGRRINMRKVIPYIASQFRKDKIWLRRTKPSKREYQIVLAIDDSSSMDDNHSKELAFESVALISKALTLLESGQLSVMSFGETTEILHKLSDTFTEKSGVKLLQKFQFQQKKTCVANLVDFVTNMFSNIHTNALNAKLLVVVSDGRGIFSEGELFVQQAIRRAKFADIFMVFVIIDNPENKNSILDIRMPVFKDGKLLGIKSYLDSFPFPFYIILRDINSLPSVLSDALRQWFELVTNTDK